MITRNMVLLASGAFLLGGCRDNPETQADGQSSMPGTGVPLPAFQEIRPYHDDILFMMEQKKKGSAAFREMREKLVSLPAELSPHDARGILEMILETPGEDQWVLITWAAFVNDSLNVIADLAELPADFASYLDKLNRDAAQPHVLRDYALQHAGGLALAYVNGGQNTRDMSSEEVAVLSQLLQRNLSEYGSLLCGTALNVSENLVTSAHADPERRNAFFTGREQLAEVCEAILDSAESCEHSLISSLGVLSRLESDQGTSRARQLLNNETTPVLVKAAATHYLIPYAEENDITLWQKMASATDKRLAVPARAALARQTQPHP